MFGSGEKTVAPTICLPSLSFCLAVLYRGAGALCCCTCAFPGAIQHKMIQITVNMKIRLAVIGFSSSVGITRAAGKDYTTQRGRAYGFWALAEALAT